MEKNLVISEETKERVLRLINEIPELNKYYSEVVCEEIGCSLEDMVCLSVHPDNIEEDEEGWEIKSFFPTGSEIKVEEISDNYNCDNCFLIGGVERIIYDGKVFIGDVNGSPYTVYANPNNL